MRVTIVAEENRVSVEGQSETVDCSALSDIHVIQWYGTSGEIEYFNAPGADTLKGNVRITDFSPYQQFIDAWTVAAKQPLVVATEPVVANAA